MCRTKNKNHWSVWSDHSSFIPLLYSSLLWSGSRQGSTEESHWRLENKSINPFNMKYPRVLKLAADTRISPPTYSVLRISICVLLRSLDCIMPMWLATTICRLSPTKLCIRTLWLKSFQECIQNTIPSQFELCKNKKAALVSSWKHQ